MIFIGHFSLDEAGWDEKQRHGYLTCLVESDNVDEAMESFEQLLKNAKDNDDHCAAWQAIYIEDIIQMPSIPKKAVITRYQSSAGEFPKSISHTLPMDENPDRVAYGLKEDVDRLAHDEEARYSEMKPFIVF